ncbi:MAG TPA: TlpA disulfide reductase family protein, partial [Pseudonocardiaceae bacterium]
DLAQLRAAADLAPCPGAPANGGATDGGATGGAVTESAAADGGGAAGGPSGTALDGVTVTCLATGAAMPLGAAVAGADTLVNVWAHTCEPCRDELPALQEYALRPDAARVVALQVDGSPEAGLAMLTALGVRLPSVHDVNDAARAALGAPPVLPLSYVVSGGQVRLVNPPVVFRDADEVAATVARYRGAA